MDLLDVGVEVEVEVSRLADVLGIGTGLSADDIEEQGEDNLDKTEFVIFSPQTFHPTFCVQRSSGTWGLTPYQLETLIQT